jgi:hypothetical protein
MTAQHLDVSGVNARLDVAAASGDGLEVILVLRGRVRRAPGAGRWRIRLENGRVLTFPAELVVAATPVPRGPRRGRR